jgi:probable DNA metabolism protein
MIGYRYDGSFDGMLCCVFEAFLKKEEPDVIFADGKAQATLLPVRQIVTEPEKARRVERGIRLKISERAWGMVRDGFLCCMAQKERIILRFIRMLFRRGAQAAGDYAAPEVDALVKGLRHMQEEGHLLEGFVRFSDYDGVLVSVISPKNQVLPILAAHFSDRMPGERFMIYDQNHKVGFVHTGTERQYLEIESLELPAAGAEELAYRALWRGYFRHLSIQERENPLCQRTHLALRYRPWMTEFTEDEGGYSQNPIALPQRICYAESNLLQKEAIK